MKILVQLKSKRMGVWVICFVIAAVLTYTYIHVKTMQSESYQISKMFLLQNDKVNNTFGRPLQVKLNIFKGDFFKYTPRADQTAKYKVSLHGSINTGKAILELIDRNGDWVITMVRLTLKNGEKIKITIRD